MVNYWYFFLFFVVTAAFSAGLLLFVALIRYRRHDYGDKCLVYECGLDPVTPDARDRYSIRFYLLALVFIVFEVETIFLFPWAIYFDQLKLFGVVEMFLFIAILMVGFVYAWRMQALDFRRDLD